jgi:transcriptional regulator with XRE-family HTH domain
MFKPNYLLKGKRISVNMNQAEVAKVLGLSHNAYSQKECGKRKFNTDEIGKLAILFKLSPVETCEIFLPQVFTHTEQNK